MERNTIQNFGNRIQVDTERAALNHIKNIQAGAGNGPKINPNAVVCEGYLRLEVDGANRDSYAFNVLTNQGGATVTENRLKVSDMFLVTDLFFGVLYDPGAGLGTPATRGSAKLATYNNVELETLYTGDAEAFWNAYLEIRVDETVYFDSYDTRRFYRAGMAQLGVEVSTGATNPAYVADQWTAKDWGFSRLTPFIFFGGRSNNKVELQLPTSYDFSGGGSAPTIICRGMQIQNAYGN